MKIYLSRPHMSGRELDYVREAFESNYVAPLGPQVDAFEAATASYLGERLHCVALSSGSAALHLALRLSGVATDSEVWVSSMTFAGGIFPVLYQGARPVFFDLDPSTWTINVDLVVEALKDAARRNHLPSAIIATDLYGQSADLDPLETVAGEYGIALILDSAESFGAEYRGKRKCGTGGDAAILSFNGNKIITTSGGGMLVTRSEKMASQARFLATQARDPAPHYEHSTYGYNYRLSNISAAIGLGQLEVLDQRVAKRRDIYRRYKSALEQPGLSFMPEPEGYYSSHWLTALTLDPAVLGVSREDVRLALLEHEIESRPLWKPMHLQPLFRGARYVGQGVDEGLFETGLCLPSGSDMSDAQQDEVIARLTTVLNRHQP